MSYILLLVLSAQSVVPHPHSFTMSEFQTKEACEVALETAKHFYYTVNDESKCISVKTYLDKQKLEKQIEEDKKKLGND